MNIEYIKISKEKDGGRYGKNKKNFLGKVYKVKYS